MFCLRFFFKIRKPNNFPEPGKSGRSVRAIRETRLWTGGFGYLSLEPADFKSLIKRFNTELLRVCVSKASPSTHFERPMKLDSSTNFSVAPARW